ncbi:hypothetical protein ACFL4T_01990 [candidate division KSB1 bacterium]
MNRIILTFILLIIPISIFSQTPVYYEGYTSAFGVYAEYGRPRFNNTDLRKNFGSPVELNAGIFYFHRKTHNGFICNINYLKKTQIDTENAVLKRLTVNLDFARCAFTAKGKAVFYVSGGITLGWRWSKIIEPEKEKTDFNIGGNLQTGLLYRLKERLGFITDIQIIALKTGKLNTGSTCYKAGLSYLF